MAWHGALYNGRLNSVAQDDRNFVEAAVSGVGVFSAGDLVVSAGSGMNSTVAAGRATIRNTFASVQGGLYLVRNDASVAYPHSAADPTNPRIDSVYAKVYDSETGGDASDQTTAVIVAGTATSGATLDNRTGAGVAPSNNSILLADVLVPNGASSSASFTYRDRRPVAVSRVPALALVDIQPLRPADGLGQFYDNPAQLDGYQAAAAMYLPRRIKSATKLRWSYNQTVAAETGNYNWGIYDASGRFIVSTGVTALIGSASTIQTRAETIASTTFEAGMYYVCIGWASLSGGSSVMKSWMCGAGAAFLQSTPFNNLLLWSATGGTTLPTTLASFTDAATGIGAIGVPLLGLSQS